MFWPSTVSHQIICVFINQEPLQRGGNISARDRLFIFVKSRKRLKQIIQLLPSINNHHVDRRDSIANELLATIDEYRDRFSLEDFRLDWENLNTRHSQRNYELILAGQRSGNVGLELTYLTLQQLAILLEITVNDIHNYRSARWGVASKIFDDHCQEFQCPAGPHVGETVSVG